MSADELAHAFDRFWRGAGSRDTAGSGLGLAIVRQVAQAHGGEASVANPNGGGPSSGSGSTD
ncbi:MAG: ATP-binding protein [Solirubrobacterales bacterium]